MIIDDQKKWSSWWLLDSLYKGPVMRKVFPCQDIMMQMTKENYIRQGSHLTPCFFFMHLYSMPNIQQFYIISTLYLFMFSNKNRFRQHSRQVNSVDRWIFTPIFEVRQSAQKVNVKPYLTAWPSLNAVVWHFDIHFITITPVFIS